MSTWIKQLADAISIAINSLRVDGITSMSEANLRQIVRTPQGGPTEGDLPHLYKTEWFPAAVALLSESQQRFIR